MSQFDPAPVPSTMTDKDANLWGMIMHLSQLGNFVVPMSGVIAPIVIWQLKKNDSPVIDAHGKNIVNWLISGLIYGLICTVLALVFIGFFMAIALGIAAIAFAIIGGIKANGGEVWKYPGTISFFK
ncbi:MAG: DUF4870 domain-containing protein [Mariniblastus sp.]